MSDTVGLVRVAVGTVDDDEGRRLETIRGVDEHTVDDHQED